MVRFSFDYCCTRCWKIVYMGMNKFDGGRTQQQIDDEFTAWYGGIVTGEGYVEYPPPQASAS